MWTNMIMEILASDAKNKQTSQSPAVYIHIFCDYAKCVQVFTSRRDAPGCHGKAINVTQY